MSGGCIIVTVRVRSSVSLSSSGFRRLGYGPGRFICSCHLSLLLSLGLVGLGLRSCRWLILFRAGAFLRRTHRRTDPDGGLCITRVLRCSRLFCGILLSLSHIPAYLAVKSRLCRDVDSHSVRVALLQVSFVVVMVCVDHNAFSRTSLAALR